ncbi:hypothetical protein CRYUN_Cryun08bG0126200 [Craigia yunnanensis]
MDNGGLHATPVVHFVERLGKLFQFWILMFCFILAPKMVQIFVPGLLKWVESSNSHTWFDIISFLWSTASCLVKRYPSLFPLVDPNIGVAMYESDEIIKYLVGKYGDGSVPFMLSLSLLKTLTEGFAMIGRMGKGTSCTPSKLPRKSLELWSFEGSHSLRLCENCPRGSPKRQILYEKAGHFQVPYLEDPNTGVQMFESAEIAEYLRATYVQ